MQGTRSKKRAFVVSDEEEGEKGGAGDHDDIKVVEERRERLKELVRGKSTKGIKSLRSSSTHAEAVNAVTNYTTEHKTQSYGKHLPYDNFGSFFGPYHKVVPDRALQEARARKAGVVPPKEKRRKTTLKDARAVVQTKPAAAKPAAVKHSTSEVALKAQYLQQSRDYSFLFTDEDPTSSTPPISHASELKRRSSPRAKNAPIKAQASIKAANTKRKTSQNVNDIKAKLYTNHELDTAKVVDTSQKAKLDKKGKQINASGAPKKPVDQRATSQQAYPKTSDVKKKYLPHHSESSEEGVRATIRKMFGYNPEKYHDIDDEDGSDMETDFHTIEMEEKRSERIARKEDDRELALIEKEEREEKARKKAKKRKLVKKYKES